MATAAARIGRLGDPSNQPITVIIGITSGDDFGVYINFGEQISNYDSTVVTPSWVRKNLGYLHDAESLPRRMRKLLRLRRWLDKHTWLNISYADFDKITRDLNMATGSTAQPMWRQIIETICEDPFFVGIEKIKFGVTRSTFVIDRSFSYRFVDYLIAIVRLLARTTNRPIDIFLVEKRFSEDEKLILFRDLEPFHRFFHDPDWDAVQTAIFLREHFSQ